MSKTEREELTEAVQDLYSVFRCAPPTTIDGCPCCIEKKQINKLLRTPLYELKSSHLGAYASCLFLTVGDVSDFRYFLPRIFEIASLEDEYPSPEIVLGKLNLAKWNKWRPKEMEATHQFMNSWLKFRIAREALDTYFYANDIDELVCGIALTGADLGKYF